MRKRRPRSKQASSVASVLGSSFKSLGVEGKIREYKITKSWETIVGKTLAARCSVEKLVGETLYVTVASSAWMSELRYQKSSILEKLETVTGKEKRIKDIIFKSGAVKRPKQTLRPGRARHKLSDRDRRFIYETVNSLKETDIKEKVRRAMTKSMSFDE